MVERGLGDGKQGQYPLKRAFVGPSTYRISIPTEGPMMTWRWHVALAVVILAISEGTRMEKVRA